ncbi:MAG: ATP-binding cassette domain-containing protein, partial [Desulfovibrionaceae bacterium]
MRDILIQLTDARVARGGRDLLSGIDFTLARGEHWAVLGENGSGKTTLLRLLRGEIPPTSGDRRYRLDPGEPPCESPAGLRQRLPLVTPQTQEVYAGAGWSLTGEDAVLAGFFDTWLLYETPDEAMRQAARRALADLEAARLADKRVAEMSTGELRLVLLARALAGGPDVLFLDEHLDGLDRAARRAVRRATELAGARTALVVAAHRAEDQPEPRPASGPESGSGVGDRAILLEAGRMVAQGTLAEVTARYAGAPRPAAAIPGLLAPEPSGAEVLVRLTGVNVTRDGAPILRDVDWEVRRGEQWAVVGANGAGKSTLLAVVLGLADTVLGSRVEHFDRPGLPEFAAVRRRVPLVSDEAQTAYVYDVTAREAVLSGFFGSIGLYEPPDGLMLAKADAALEFMGLAGLAQRRIKSLSYGQMRRVLLARALAGEPELMLLDEPLSGLDAASRRDALQ